VIFLGREYVLMNEITVNVITSRFDPLDMERRMLMPEARLTRHETHARG